MRRFFKWLFVMVLIGGILAGVAYQSYHYVLEAVAHRVRREIKDNIFGVVNPLRWPKKFLGL